MEKTLEKVSKIVTEQSALQVEKLAQVLVIKENKQFGYTQDQIGQMTNVLSAESRIQKIEETAHEESLKIVKLLEGELPNWQEEVQAKGGFNDFLKDRGVEVKMVSLDEQKEITKKAIGVALTIEDMVERLNKL